MPDRRQGSGGPGPFASAGTGLAAHVGRVGSFEAALRNQIDSKAMVITRRSGTLFLLCAAFVACFGADGVRYAARRLTVEYLRVLSLYLEPHAELNGIAL